MSSRTTKRTVAAKTTGGATQAADPAVAAQAPTEAAATPKTKNRRTVTDPATTETASTTTAATTAATTAVVETEASAKSKKAPKPPKEPKAPKVPKDDEKKRTSMHIRLNLHIAVPRCASSMRGVLKASNTAGSLHLGHDAPVAMTAIAHYATTELVETAMKRTAEGGKTLVSTDSLTSGDNSGLACWPLVCNLAAFAAKPAAEATEATEAAEATEATEAAEAVEDENAADSKVSPAKYKTYVDIAIGTAKTSTEAYGSLRVSSPFREFVCDVVAQMVHRLTSIALCAVQELAKSHTLGSGLLMTVTKMSYLAVGGELSEEALKMLAFVSAKVVRYHELEKAQADARLKNLSPEKKAELDAKRAAEADAKALQRAERLHAAAAKTAADAAAAEKAAEAVRAKAATA